MWPLRDIPQQYLSLGMPPRYFWHCTKNQTLLHPPPLTQGDGARGHSTKYHIYIENPRLSPRRNWDPPTPSPASDCVPPLWNQRRGEIHSPASEGVGGAQFGRLEKKPSTLSSLWGTVKKEINSMRIYIVINICENKSAGEVRGWVRGGRFYSMFYSLRGPCPILQQLYLYSVIFSIDYFLHGSTVHIFSAVHSKKVENVLE